MWHLPARSLLTADNSCVRVRPSPDIHAVAPQSDNDHYCSYEENVLHVAHDTPLLPTRKVAEALARLHLGNDLTQLKAAQWYLRYLLLRYLSLYFFRIFCANA